MKLIYRALTYESKSPMTQMVETGITARFRGQTYQVHRPLVQSYSQPQTSLKYRGVAYPANLTLVYSNASDFTTGRSLVVDGKYIAQ